MQEIVLGRASNHKIFPQYKCGNCLQKTRAGNNVADFEKSQIEMLLKVLLKVEPGKVHWDLVKKW